MDINIGITPEARENSAKAVSRLMADTYTLYLKTHGYHWNVEGPHFQQLHIQGHFAPSSYAAMAKLSSILEEDGRPDWQMMVKNLAKGHEQVAKTAREVLRIAEEAGDDATADVVAPRVTLHEKTAWMLRATAS